ncbi:hypothetical protein BC940DRAFT_311916 [Gongronella butleri]|nr:hypothetical protein BC940DRAFT_311916 [Gongronella butleri]
MEKQETVQTILITSHYGWDQSDKHVILYIPLPQAKTLSTDQCVMTLAPRSIELLIKDHGGYNYKFKLTKLFADLDPGAHKIKLKTSKVVVYLNKKVVGKHWNDVKMKRISDVMYQLQRSDDALQTDKFGIVPTDMDDRLLNGYGHQALKEAIKDAFQHETPLVRKAIDEKLAKQNNAYKNNQDPFYLPGLSSSTIKSSTEISVIPPPSDAHHHKHHYEDDDDDDEACHDH